MPASSNPTVVLRNAGVTYSVYKGGSNRSIFGARSRVDVRALQPINLVANAGESIGVLGRNGSGKSTLCSLIAGSIAPSSGEVLVSSPPTLLGVSAALQSHLSGRINIRLGLLAMGLSPKEVSALEEPVADWADIGNAIDRPLRTYSSGQKARLRFSISTAIRREILLVDEALSTGDATFAARAKERMSSFLSEAGTIFLVSHGPSVIKEYCNRAIWLHDGQLIADGDVDSIADGYRAWSSFTARKRFDKAETVMGRFLRQKAETEIVLQSETDSHQSPES